MTDATVISRKVLGDATYDLLRTRVANAAGYLGEAGTVPPYGSDPGRTESVPTLDTAGHVRPYWVLHASGGTPGPELDIADTIVDLDWLIQITAAAGYVADLEALVTRIDAALYRTQLVVEGLSCGPFKPPPGYQPQGLLDSSVSPHRPFMALQYVARFTRN